MKRIEYFTHDKSEWEDGAWQIEPDKIQYMDEESGFPCLIVRNMSGALCGYVGVSSTHPAFEQDYDDVKVDVHGGLTFADHCTNGNDEMKAICHTVEHGEDDNVWWLGFDCNHFQDLAPAMDARYKKLQLKMQPPGYKYKDIKYVEKETKNLARQLKNYTA